MQGIEGWEKEVTCATDYLEGRVGSVLVRHGVGGGGGGGGLEGGVRWTMAADWRDECGLKRMVVAHFFGQSTTHPSQQRVPYPRHL